MSDRPTFWFAAKRYGWGWGLPVRWQGWLVLGAYFTLLYGGITLLAPRSGTIGLLAYLIVITVALLVIVVLKGERPLRWRWRGK